MFQGAFACRLEPEGGGAPLPLPAEDRTWRGLEPGARYVLLVDEDEELGVGNAELSALGGGVGSGAWSGAAGSHSSGPGGGGGAAGALTAQLKQLSPEELRAQTEEYKALKEARDREEVLFSG